MARAAGASLAVQANDWAGWSAGLASDVRRSTAADVGAAAGTSAECALLRHRFDAAAATTFDASAPSTEVTGTAAFEFADAAAQLRSAQSAHDVLRVQAQLVRASIAACDLADPFLTTPPGIDAESGAGATFSDAIVATDLDSLGVAAARAEADPLTAAVALARESASRRGAVGAALPPPPPPPAAPLRALRRERLSAALALVRSVVSVAGSAAESRAPMALRAWPNPTRGDLSLGFDLPVAAPVWVEVIDVAGRRVASQELGRRPAGLQTLALAQGLMRALGPGAYYVRLEAGRLELTSRVVRTDR